ncbi:uncharacterized protein LODBEIA_P18950 [Lodderomyces beijingensis]|uniref:Uncharacterized protein n=1 Tax=Lodderomyces beijingensis TaxID=1775926 RepID=A0ABP0ZKM5_9ASCO
MVGMINLPITEGWTYLEEILREDWTFAIKQGRASLAEFDKRYVPNSCILNKTLVKLILRLLSLFSVTSSLYFEEMERVVPEEYDVISAEIANVLSSKYHSRLSKLKSFALVDRRFADGEDIDYFRPGIIIKCLEIDTVRSKFASFYEFQKRMAHDTPVRERGCHLNRLIADKLKERCFFDSHTFGKRVLEAHRYIIEVYEIVAHIIENYPRIEITTNDSVRNQELVDSLGTSLDLLEERFQVTLWLDWTKIQQGYDWRDCNFYPANTTKLFKDRLQVNVQMWEHRHDTVLPSVLAEKKLKR